MQKTLKEIAKLIDGQVVGDENIVIRGVCGIKEAGVGDITFLANPKYLPFVDKTRASAVITGRDIQNISKPVIRTDNPSLAFIKVVTSFSPQDLKHPKGISPTVILGKNVVLGKNVAVGAFASIEDGVVIGDNSIIYNGVYVGQGTKIGNNVIIYPNTVIHEAITIGNRVVIHSGSVIGSEGFGFINVDGKNQRIPQIGTVVIEDDVEIGANVAIDRARFDKTLVCKGTKIDNLVHIAHNVIIGENSVILAQVGISGSTVIGKNVTLAGQAGLVGHITIGDGATVAAQGGVTKSVPPNVLVSGYPAKPHGIAKKVNACLQNLPRLYEIVNALKKKIVELEARLKK